ncbi:MAG: TRAP transporter TAXI family solute receptor [Alphaproteobacteria bacterium]|jgi:TRAP transporter TAXI family solute receptor
MWDFIKIYVPIGLLIAAGFLFTWQFVDPAPPKALVIATGSPDGAYTDYAKRYQKVLAEAGLQVTIRHTAGATENLGLLNDPKSGVDVAFVQGGIGDPFGAPKLVSLGSVFLEPLWLFVRASGDVKRINDLKGKRIALGNLGSGTRVLAKTMLVANGIDDENATFQSIGGSQAAQALASGEIDAAFFVSARVSDSMASLIRNPAVRILNFARAETYTRLYSYLSRIQVPEGVLALDANIPPTSLDLVAPTAALVARDDLHPALIDLVLGAANRVHQPGNHFTPANTFPSPNFVDFPLSSDARRYFKSGPTFLRRVLPFWAAVLVERLLIMLVPLITIMIPLFKIAPPAYRWGVRRKILRWYKELREIEAVVYVGENVPSREELETRLDEMQREAGHLKLPLGYAEQLYHLRLHIAFVKQLMMASAEESPAKAPA